MTQVNKWLLALCIIMASLGAYGLYREHVAVAVLDEQTKEAKTQLQSIQKDADAKTAALQVKYDALELVKQRTVTVTQIIKELPKQVDLPDPGIGEVTPKQADAATAADPTGPVFHAGDMIIPKLDAKPIFDSVIAAKECAVDLAKEQVKTDTLTKTVAVKDQEIDDRDKVIKGGTKWTRAKSASKWVAVGAIIGGSVAAYLTHK